MRGIEVDIGLNAREIGIAERGAFLKRNMVEAGKNEVLELG